VVALLERVVQRIFTVGLLLRSASGDGQAALGAQASLDQLDATIGDIRHFACQWRGRPDPAEGSSRQR
jgi:hypothetical protein